MLDDVETDAAVGRRFTGSRRDDEGFGRGIASLAGRVPFGSGSPSLGQGVESACVQALAIAGLDGMRMMPRFPTETRASG